MTIRRKQYNLGLCPSPGKQNGKEFRTPVAMTQSYDAETNRITVTVYMLPEGMNPPDKIYDLYLCPQGRVCGCYYGTSIGWEIDDTLCMADIYWTWPSDAGCLLKSGSLIGTKSGIQLTEELAEDPDWEIYPVRDIRNPDCPGCGMSGADRETTAETPVPGEQFTLNACIDEGTCIGLYGAQGCHPIGSERFQTVGFMGGEITSIVDESTRTYQIQIGDVVMEISGCDLTGYEIGDWVALSKVDTDFPLDAFDQRVPVTNVNVPTVDEYIILPYQFQGVA